MEKVVCNSCSLCLPIKPQTSCAVMDMVSSDGHVYSSVELDTCRLCSTQLLRIADMVDVTVLYDGENTAHTSYDTGLFAVVNVAASDDVASDFFLEPSVELSAAYSISFHLCRALYLLMEEIHIVLGIPVFSE